MGKVDKRFTVLFSQEEILLLKDQARVRGISAGELVRLAVQNEIYRKSSFDRILAIGNIAELGRKSLLEQEHI